MWLIFQQVYHLHRFLSVLFKILNGHTKNPTKTGDFFNVSVTPKDASFDTDVRLQASSNEWTEIFGTDAKYSGLNFFDHFNIKLE